jgi:outer membrane lipoprotein SlyB
MKGKAITHFLLAIVCCMLLANCSKNIAPGDYDTSEVGKIKKVVPGKILSIRPVRLHSAHEALAGNNEVPQDAYSTNSGKSHGYEYVIKLNSGQIISVVQAEEIKLKPKQHVLVIYGNNTRVVPDDGSEDF